MRQGRSKVQVEERVLTEHHVTIEAPLGQYFAAEDIIAFAKELEKAQAPANALVKITLQREGQRAIKSMRVDWTEDLINGQPAPRVMEEEYHAPVSG